MSDLDRLEALRAAATPGRLGCFFHTEDRQELIDDVHIRRGEAYYKLTGQDFRYLQALWDANLIGRIRVLEGREAKLRELHVPGWTDDHNWICDECQESPPCSTVRILDSKGELTT